MHLSTISGFQQSWNFAAMALHTATQLIIAWFGIGTTMSARPAHAWSPGGGTLWLLLDMCRICTWLGYDRTWVVIFGRLGIEFGSYFVFLFCNLVRRPSYSAMLFVAQKSSCTSYLRVCLSGERWGPPRPQLPRGWKTHWSSCTSTPWSMARPFLSPG
jgi:hypothetical protein